jgi:hypothetical protein
MNTRRLIVVTSLAAGIFLVATACSNPFAPTTTEEAATTVAPEVKTRVEEFLSRVNAHDATAAGEYFSADPGFQWVEDGRIVYETREAAVAGLTAFFAGFGESRLEGYDIKVVMLSDEAAVATFKVTQTIAASGQALKAEGAMSLALTQRDGSWKILVAHKSSSGFPR